MCKIRRLNPRRSAIILANGSSELTLPATDTHTPRSLRPCCAAIADKALVSSHPERRIPQALERSIAF